MYKTGRDGFTVVQVNDEMPTRHPATWTIAVGAAALMGLCAFAVPSVQLWAPSQVTGATSVAGIAVPQNYRAAFYAPAMATTIEAQTAELETPVFTASSPASQTLTTIGGALAMFGAAFAFAWRMAAPKPETITLLPMTGMTEGLEFDDGMEEIFTFTNLRAAPGSRHRKKRKGRGHAAGQGATCGFGTRGQKSRKGRSVRPGFEGGQNPLWRRTPKLRGRPLGPGHKRILYQMVSIAKLSEEAEGSTVQFDDLSGGQPVLFKVGGVKVNEEATVPKNLTVKAHAFTTAAKAAIEGAGGKCIKLDKYSRELNEEGKVAEKVAMFTFSGQMASYCDDDMDSDDELLMSEDSDFMSDVSDEEIAMFAATAVRSVKVGKYKDPAPRGKRIPESKKAIVEQVHGTLKGAFLVFGFDVKGYTMAQIKTLRKAMPAGVKVQVVKNTLFRMASRGTGFEALDPLTMGSKAWVFVPESSFQEAIKAYTAFLKETKKQETNPIIGGSVEAQLLKEQQVIALSDLPTKKELIEKLAKLLKGIQTRVALAVKATPRKLAFAIKLATLPEDKAEA